MEWEGVEGAGVKGLKVRFEEWGCRAATVTGSWHGEGGSYGDLLNSNEFERPDVRDGMR